MSYPVHGQVLLSFQHTQKKNNKLQSNLNGSNTFGTLKICSRQGQCEPVRVDNSARSEGILRISLIFYIMKVCCVFSLESPH